MLALGTYPKLLVPLALCFLACAPQESEPETPNLGEVSMFAGHLEGTDSVVGLAMSAEGHVEAYICGGDTTFSTYSRWFVGPLSAGSASLKSDGFQLDLSLKTDAMAIALTPPGEAALSTLAAKANAGDRSAVYESPADSECRWGVVVVDNGAPEPEIHGTWCGFETSNPEISPDGPAKIFAQVTPVLPIDYSKPFLPVRVNTPDGEQIVNVYRVGSSAAAQ